MLNYDSVASRIKQSDKIPSLMSMLHWNISNDEATSTITQLLDVLCDDDYDMLMLAGHKHTWRNTVKLIAAAGYPKNKKALPSLVLQLQDLNWPGANEGMHVLKMAHEADKDVLIPILEAAIESAFVDSDFIWLAGIKQFLALA